jgi:hypothetical protein
VLILIVGAVAAWAFGAPGTRTAPAPPLTPAAHARPSPTIDVAATATAAAEEEALVVAAAAAAAQAAAEEQAAAEAAAALAKPSPSPFIVRFALNPPTPGTVAGPQLSWELGGTGSSTRLSRTIAESETPAELRVFEQTEYTLTATNEGGDTTASLSVFILRPPEIIDFQSSHRRVRVGEPVTLSWETLRATLLYLDDQVLTVLKGTVEVRPTQDTVYTLKGVNAAGESERRIRVSVEAAPPPLPSPSAQPGPAGQGTPGPATPSPGAAAPSGTPAPPAAAASPAASSGGATPAPATTPASAGAAPAAPATATRGS